MTSTLQRKLPRTGVLVEALTERIHDYLTVMTDERSSDIDVRSAATECLRVLTALDETTRWFTKEAVRIARATGATWAEIGQALDISTQGAHKRFGGTK